MPENFNISSSDIESGKAMGGIAYLFEPIGFLIALISSKDNRYVMYHAQQALIIMIFWVIGNIFWVASVIPIIGWLIDIVIILGDIVLLVLWIMGMVNGFTGKVEPVPLIGKLAFKFNLCKQDSSALIE